MAKRAIKTAPVWKGKPLSKGKPPGKPRAKSGKPADVVSVPAEPEKPALPVDLASCVIAISQVCDEIDELLNKPRRDRVSMGRPYYDSPLWKLRKQRLEPLIDIVERLLNPTPVVDPEAPEPDPNEVEEEVERKYRNPREYLIAELRAELGTVPSWSRPGAFLLWFGFIPVLGVWRGVFADEAFLEAIDPRLMWIGAEPRIDVPDGIMPDHASPVDALRYVLRVRAEQTVHDRKGKRVPMMRLHHLEAEATDAARLRLDANPWLWEALRAGPRDPVPMPEHLLLAQPPLM